MSSDCPFLAFQYDPGNPVAVLPSVVYQKIGFIPRAVSEVRSLTVVLQDLVGISEFLPGIDPDCPIGFAGGRDYRAETRLQ
jgi:hypothetical protein